MHNPKLFAPLFSILAVLALALTACSPGPAATPSSSSAVTTRETAPDVIETTSENATTGEPIKVGVIESLSGSNAASGSYVVNGFKIAVDYINSNGGICGGRPLVPVIEDGQNDPQISANAAALLITRDKVPIIMGAQASSATLAVMPVVAKNQVPLLVETSSSGKITDPSTPGFEWTFRISPTSAQEAESARPWIVSKLGFHNTALMSVNNDWGRSSATAFQKVIEAEGGKIESSVFIDAKATDVLPELTKIKNSNADSILVTTDTQQIAVILKQYRELGLKQKVLFTGGSNYPVAVKMLSSQDTVEGTYYIVFYIPDQFKYAGDPDLAERFTKEYYKQNLPEEGIGMAFRGFDGALVIAKAIELAGCKLDDPQSLKAAIPQVQIAGLGGVYKFAEADGHQARPNIYLVQMVNGKMTLPEFQFSE